MVFGQRRFFGEFIQKQSIYAASAAAFIDVILRECNEVRFPLNVELKF